MACEEYGGVEDIDGVKYPDTGGHYHCVACGREVFVIASYDHNTGSLPEGIGVICQECWRLALTQTGQLAILNAELRGELASARIMGIHEGELQ